MGNTHTRRNKRGGRHNRGAAPRPLTASPGTSASAGMPAPPPSEAPISQPPAAPARSAPRASEAPPQPRRMRIASEPSMRAPYAPGQRASRGPRWSQPADERQPAELEVTATYEEIVVIAQSAELLEDADDDQQDPRDAASEDLDADQDQEYTSHRHDGHTYDAARRNGHLRDRDRDREHDQSYTPAHLRPPFERDGTPAELNATSSPEAEREAPEATPRGDVRGDVGPLIDDLKALFQRDRATASATGGTRCGICYLHYALDALEYREDEGYYVCARCAQALGPARVPMVRQQKRA